MKTVMIVLAGSVVGVVALVLLLDRQPEAETSIPQADSRELVSSEGTSMAETSRPPAQDEIARSDTVITREQFDAMPPQNQDRAVEAFVASFWKSESAGPVDATTQEQRLSLELFERPYIRSITEDEFQRLSPEEQQKAISEITESCVQTRQKVLDLVTQARTTIAGDNPAMGEACLISALETGRELTANRNGMLITRLTGIACQKASLKELVNLHTAAGDASKAQIMQGHLRDLDAEANEIRNTAQAAGR